MATPTASKRAASQAVATPPVSTPFSLSNPHLAFSPHGPRSGVLSPQQFKKSPANSNTLYGYPSGGSGGGHPTASSFGAGYDSPSAALALGGVPGLGDLGLDAMNGAPGLGPLAGTARGDEDERRRRLQQVVDTLKVCYVTIEAELGVLILLCNRPIKGVSASPALRGWQKESVWIVSGIIIWEAPAAPGL